MLVCRYVDCGMNLKIQLTSGMSIEFKCVNFAYKEFL